MSLDTNRVRNRVCVVTGASGSIGFAIGERLAQYGAKTFLISNEEKIFDAAKQLQEQDYDATGIVLDITDHDATIAAFDEIVAKHGPVFALVNCAGVAEVGPFESMEPEMWQRVINVNLYGTVNCIQGAIRSMRESREGKIVNLASKAGKTGSKLMTVYGASKGAIITLTQALAQEYAQHNVHINALCPDIVKGTGMWGNTVSVKYQRDYQMTEEEVTEMYEKKVPLGHFATMEDVADMACFYIISADDCTGQSINITGGRFMH